MSGGMEDKDFVNPPPGTESRPLRFRVLWRRRMARMRRELPVGLLQAHAECSGTNGKTMAGSDIVIRGIATKNRFQPRAE